MTRVRINWAAIAATIVYIGSIVLANWMTSRFGLVPVGFGLLVTAGTFAAGFALLARDFVHRYGNAVWAIAAIGVGIVLSWFLASPVLAIASAAAFAISELIDLGVFVWIRPRGFVPSVLTSNAISAPIDTVVFLFLAGFPLTWTVILGQYIGKMFWATIVPICIYVLVVRYLTRPRVI